jgi:hypothetical protein
MEQTYELTVMETEENKLETHKWTAKDDDNFTEFVKAAKQMNSDNTKIVLRQQTSLQRQ